MRINLANPIKGHQSKLVKHIVHLFAEEFCAHAPAVFNHIKSGDPQVGEYVTKWLQEQGWKITWYHVPVPSSTYAPNDFAPFSAISFGWVFQSDCDQLIKWQLMNT
jgi:hypothetical protein